jgi:hypothetical protein
LFGVFFFFFFFQKKKIPRKYIHTPKTPEKPTEEEEKQKPEENKMKTIPLLLIGCGGVGRQLLQHIVSCRSLHAKLVCIFQNPLLWCRDSSSAFRTKSILGVLRKKKSQSIAFSFKFWSFSYCVLMHLLLLDCFGSIII